MNQNKEIVIDINHVGSLHALHMDEFPLSKFGRMDINRASTIDFNPETQLFDIMLKDATRYPVRQASGPLKVLEYTDKDGDDCLYPHEALGFTGYDEARRFEVDWIQESRKLGVDPLDPEGVEIIQRLRAAGDSPQL